MDQVSPADRAIVTAADHESRILVVDGSAAARAALRRRLARMGLNRTTPAADAADALKAIRLTPPDLVLLDIDLPDGGGFEVLEALAAARRLETSPVVIISAYPDVKPIVRAIKLGAEGFLLKPFPTALLRARVAATLEKKVLRDRIREELARKQAELAQARQLQLALVPPPYADGQMRLDVVLEPAREVGGDLVDHIALPDGRHLLVLGDVCGKGAGAALMMARGHALVRSLNGRGDAAAVLADPGMAAAALNRELAANNPGCMFITMLLAVFDPADGRLDYVRCGHIPPFLRRAGGGIERLDGAGGVPLGLVEAAKFRAATVWLRPGDSLLILSDGVTEAAAPDGALWGEAPVGAWLAGPRPALAALVDAVRAFEGGLAAADDLSALLLHRN